MKTCIICNQPSKGRTICKKCKRLPFGWRIRKMHHTKHKMLNKNKIK